MEQEKTIDCTNKDFGRFYVAIPILQDLDINTVRMRITSSFVILIFPKRGQILMEKMMIGILLTIIRETWKAEREWLKVRV